MISKLHLATSSDIETIIPFLSAMQDEVKELELDKEIVKQSILRSMNDKVFGTCYLQSVHSYWSMGQRYYLGGFYIAPSHRKKGRFKELNQLLKEWATEHDGIQIYCHIHEDNEHSLNAFGAVDILPTEYKLCVHHWE